MLIYHYTVGDNFMSIVKDGLIKPATKYIPLGEKPIVWFSAEQHWEPTVTKGFIHPDGTVIDLGMNGLLAQNIRLVRIGVLSDVAPYRWGELKTLSGMSAEVGRALARRGRELGADPRHWRGSFDAIGQDKWHSIETFDGDEWTRKWTI